MEQLLAPRRDALEGVATGRSEGASGVVYVDADSPEFVARVARMLAAPGYQVQPVDLGATGVAPHDRASLPGYLLLDADGCRRRRERRKCTSRPESLALLFVVRWSVADDIQSAVRAGADDIVFEPLSTPRLLETLRYALPFARSRHQRHLARAAVRARFATLSRREAAVCTYLVRGLLNKQIAQEMGIKEGTVKFHRAQVLQRLRVNSLVELARLAERCGLLDDAPGAP